MSQSLFIEILNVVLYGDDEIFEDDGLVAISSKISGEVRPPNIYFSLQFITIQTMTNRITPGWLMSENHPTF